MKMDYTLEEISQLKAAATKQKTSIAKKEMPIAAQSAIDIKKLDIATLSKVGTIKRVAAGKTIFEIGDIGDDFYLILKGKVEVLCRKNTVMAVITAGNIFGEMSVLENTPRSAKVVALEELSVLIISGNNLESLIVNIPQLSIRLMQTLSGRVRELNQSLLLLKSRISIATRRS